MVFVEERYEGKMAKFDDLKNKIAQYLNDNLEEAASAYNSLLSPATDVESARSILEQSSLREFFPAAYEGVLTQMSDYAKSLEKKPRKPRTPKPKADATAASDEAPDLGALLPGGAAPRERTVRPSPLEGAVRDAGTGSPAAAVDAGTGGSRQPAYPATGATGAIVPAEGKSPDFRKKPVTPAEQTLYRLYTMLNGEMPHYAPENWRKNPDYKRYAENGIKKVFSPDKLDELKYKTLTPTQRQELEMTRTALNDVLSELVDLRDPRKGTNELNEKRKELNDLYEEVLDYEEMLNAALRSPRSKRWHKFVDEFGKPGDKKTAEKNRRYLWGAGGYVAGAATAGLVALMLCRGCGPSDATKQELTPNLTATAEAALTTTQSPYATPSVTATSSPVPSPAVSQPTAPAAPAATAVPVDNLPSVKAKYSVKDKVATISVDAADDKGIAKIVLEADGKTQEDAEKPYQFKIGPYDPGTTKKVKVTAYDSANQQKTLEIDVKIPKLEAPKKSPTPEEEEEEGGKRKLKDI